MLTFALVGFTFGFILLACAYWRAINREEDLIREHDRAQKRAEFAEGHAEIADLALKRAEADLREEEKEHAAEVKVLKLERNELQKELDVFLAPLVVEECGEPGTRGGTCSLDKNHHGVHDMSRTVGSPANVREVLRETLEKSRVRRAILPEEMMLDVLGSANKDRRRKGRKAQTREKKGGKKGKRRSR